MLFGGGMKRRPKTALVPSPPAPLGAELEPVRKYVEAARATNTRRTYASLLKTFAAWAKGERLESLPALPTTVARYLAHLADTGKRVATIQLALVAIAQAHRLGSLADPTKHALVRDTMRGIRRRLGVAQVGKQALVVDDLRRVLAVVPDTLLGARDRSLLTLGFAGAFRRSELVSLDVEHVARTASGLEVLLTRSKTDQEGAGRKIGIPRGAVASVCPVRSLQAWLDLAGITSGSIFRRVRHGKALPGRLAPQAVALVLKRYAKRAGLDAGRLGGHSLRAGFATSAAIAGRTERAIMRQTGHKSSAMLHRYIRDLDLFAENAAAGLL